MISGKKSSILRDMFRRRDVPPKHRLTFNGLHYVITQKTELFKATVVRTSDLSRMNNELKVYGRKESRPYVSYTGIFWKDQRKPWENLSRHRRAPCRDLNMGPPEYEVAAWLGLSLLSCVPLIRTVGCLVDPPGLHIQMCNAWHVIDRSKTKCHLWA
jgi:hypothetical protein